MVGHVTQHGSFPEKHIGIAHWNSTLEKHIGKAHWKSTLEKHIGKAHWIKKTSDLVIVVKRT
jgi:hypothetical protein